MHRISRRQFAHLLAAGTAAALARPRLAVASLPENNSPNSSGLVRLSANENPYGPSAHGLKAMQDSFAISCRYPDEYAEKLVASLAKLNKVEPSQILLGDGSGEILNLCAEAFTGPLTNEDKNTGHGTLVAADPTFEAILHHAESNGAEVVKIPLTSTYSHDLPKMAAAAKKGLIYVCNPNNPTASITPKDQLHQFIANTPPGTMVLVDEAYYHYADHPDYESVIPSVKDHGNLIVARTFSKIYGMAGLRCGYCVAQKQVIDQLRAHQAWDSTNIMALVAAQASLDDAEQVTNGKRRNSEVKASLLSELEKMKYNTIPSQANFVMIDVQRPVVPLIQSLKERNVQVGRLFPALPNHMRLTIGKQEEMQAFLTAFRQVVAV